MGSFAHLLDEVDRVGYDPETNTYQVVVEWADTDSVGRIVVEVVAAVIGDDPDAMEPLHSAVDPDALVDLLAQSGEGDARLSFWYEECLVTVAAEGLVAVRPEQ
jgi:hypothetical protein